MINRYEIRWWIWPAPRPEPAAWTADEPTARAVAAGLRTRRNCTGSQIWDRLTDKCVATNLKATFEATE